jgi:hypothetical protein
MSKRTNSSNEIPPPKRPRKPAGFRLARPAPVSSQPSNSSISTSLFITVSQPEERCGTLQVQNRLLTSTQGPSTSPLPESQSQPPIEPNTEFQDSDEPILVQIQDERIQQRNDNSRWQRNGDPRYQK